MTHLAQDQRERLEDVDSNDEIFDYVHPETGEVFPIRCSRTRYSRISKTKTILSLTILGLIDSVFRVISGE